jgi:hypothetical protein
VRFPSLFQSLLFALGLLASTVASAQSTPDELAPLPTTLSAGQLQALSELSFMQVPEHPQAQARRRLPRSSLPPWSPEELAYREAVHELGVDKHRYVHCELLDGKVRTGVIVEIREEGLTLKDGITNSQWIAFTALKTPPRPVPAVGTRVVHGLQWGGLVLAMIAAIPLIPVLWIGFRGC